MISVFDIKSIEITDNSTVNFYDLSDEVVRNFSQIAPNTTVYILRDGLNILILNQSNGNPVPLKDGTNSNDHFALNTMFIENIGAKTYTPVDQADPDAGNLNLARAKDIYSYLVSNVFKGCCDCSGSGDTCSIQYTYGDTTGDWTFTSGILMMNLISANGIDFSNFFHHLPDGSWISFYQSSDPANFSVFEISNYSTASGYAIWDAVLVDGGTSYLSNPTFCVTYQPALSSGGGGSQSWQQTLDVDSDLNKDNSVDGGANDFTFTNFTDFQIGVLGLFRALAGAGGYYGGFYADPTTGRMETSGTGSQSAKVSVTNSGGVPIITIRSTDGTGQTCEIVVQEDSMFIVTPNVFDNTATNGQVLTLIDETNGQVEFQDVGAPTGHALTKTDDTNVTLTLGGTPATALLQAVSMTLGWTGVLSIARGGTNSSTALSNNRVMQSSGGAIVEAAAITASRALVSDANGIPVAATTTATELDYVNGVTSSIQAQLGTLGVASNDVSDTSTNVLKDLTGCSVSVVSGATYYFLAFGTYDASSTAIGSRWTVNGPSLTALGYGSNYSLSATTQTLNQGLSAYQLPASNNSTSAATAGNTFKIEGIITPSANGTLQVQFACEGSGGTITAKKGSFLRVIRLI